MWTEHFERLEIYTLVMLSQNPHCLEHFIFVEFLCVIYTFSGLIYVVHVNSFSSWIRSTQIVQFGEYFLFLFLIVPFSSVYFAELEIRERKKKSMEMKNAQKDLREPYY